jgi:hypothetical protein
LSCSVGEKIIAAVSVGRFAAARTNRRRGGNTKKIALGLAATALLAISAGTAIAGPASAAPIIIRDTVTSPIFETGLPHDCRPGLTGTIVGTDVLSFQSIETAQGFHIHGTFVDKARIDWSDGSYTLVDSVDHFSFNAVGQGTEVFTETHTDSGDFFSAAGVFEFRLTFHEIEHFTVTDGVVRVDLEKGHLHSFGDC